MMRGPGPVLILRIAEQTALDAVAPQLAGLRGTCRDLRVLAIADAGSALVPPPGVAVVLDMGGSFASAYGGHPSSV